MGVATAGQWEHRLFVPEDSSGRERRRETDQAFGALNICLEWTFVLPSCVKQEPAEALAVVLRGKPTPFALLVVSVCCHYSGHSPQARSLGPRIGTLST